MSHAEHLIVPPRADMETLVEAWGARIDAPLLQLAFVYRPYANKAGGIVNNERLEFLGGSVLSIVVTRKLYKQHPNVVESDLSRIRAATASQQSLAAAARRIGLGGLAFLGKGESIYGGRDEGSILSDTFEVPIGATYPISNLEEARRVILERLSFLLVGVPLRSQYQDWRAILIGYSQAQGLDEVSYEIEGEGPDHQHVFMARTFISERPNLIGSGQTSSEKYAENVVARDTMSRLSPKKQ